MASVAAINNLGGHAHNPRGNLWFNDESTFGHKLLMKMGWNKGKGLGKNEDGIKENVKVKFRNKNSGLGFKDDTYTNVMSTEYESILQGLAAEYSGSGTTNLNKNVDSTENAVQKSKIVKSKLRYPKLFFGKDVTKYSEKDMKSIFICSTPLKSTEENSENHLMTDAKDVKNEIRQTFNTHNNTLSISDYFAKKMEEKRNNSAICHKASLEPGNAESSTLTVCETAVSKRKLKDLATKETEDVVIENFSSYNTKSCRKRKKKKSETSLNDTEGNPSEIEPHILNEPILENASHKNICDSNLFEAQNITDQSSSRPNKKRKLTQVPENYSVESSENPFNCKNELTLLPTKEKKKKKKKSSEKDQIFLQDFQNKNSSISTEFHEEEINKNLLLEPVEDELSVNTNYVKKKKKHKKKLKDKLKSCLKKKCGSYSLKNVSFNDTVLCRIIDSETESAVPLVCNENLDDNTTFNNCTQSDATNSINDTCSEEKTSSCEENSNDICANEKDSSLEESDNECIRCDLPSTKSSHYNDWVESQRQALKMDLYKKIFKSIKNHKILKTSNLISIKGYGNWGF